MAAVDGVIITYIYTGVQGEVIPRHATHFIAHESVTVIPAYTISFDDNIIEVYCHAGVQRIGEHAFNGRYVKRVVMSGVEEVVENAFTDCTNIEYVKCPKVEIFGVRSFCCCRKLRSIDLLSARVVEDNAFASCEALTDATFGKHLESLGSGAFWNCPSLERITIPLKDRLITADDVFGACENLKRVDLVEETILHETIDALLMEEWKNDMNAELDSINQTLLDTLDGKLYYTHRPSGRRAQLIREWIARVLRKIVHYKAQHRHILNEAASTLQLALPNDIVTNYLLPFLELPSYEFEREHVELPLP